MTEIVVTVARGAPMNEVVAALSDAGMVVGQRLDAIGLVTGHLDGGNMAPLAGIPGVKRVELSHQVQLAPPESVIW